MLDAEARERDSLRVLASDRVAARLFKRDKSLWPPPSPGGDPPDRAMGWLDLPDDLSGLGGPLDEFARAVRQEGFTDAVVCGMGGSSMTAEVLRAMFQPRNGLLKLHVLDTVNPDTVQRFSQYLDLSRTLFLIASKSGTTIEPLTLEAHFRKVLSQKGADAPRHFVALSDAGSPMAERAGAGEFRQWFETPRDVGGRFSALTPFGMLPAALLGLSPTLLAPFAVRERNACRSNYEYNPGLLLGGALGGNALHGRDKVTLITSPRLARFSLWVEQLLAESTGKNGRGLIPVAGEPLLEIHAYGQDRQFVYLRLDADRNFETDGHVNRIEAAGHPVIQQEIGQPEEIAGLFFRWEVATVVAARVIGVYPFDQPDVESAKQKARAILSAMDHAERTPAMGFAEAVEAATMATVPGSYVAIGAFIDESDALTSAFNRLRESISSRTGMATTFGYGPRYQHSIGQLYKGGPAEVRMLVVKSHGTVDLPAPGTSYTLSALNGALADGDAEAMRDKGRRSEAVVLGDNPVAEVIAAAAKLDQKH